MLPVKMFIGHLQHLLCISLASFFLCNQYADGGMLFFKVITYLANRRLLPIHEYKDDMLAAGQLVGEPFYMVLVFNFILVKGIFTHFFFVCPFKKKVNIILYGFSEF